MWVESGDPMAECRGRHGGSRPRSRLQGTTAGARGSRPDGLVGWLAGSSSSGTAYCTMPSRMESSSAGCSTIAVSDSCLHLGIGADRAGPPQKLMDVVAVVSPEVLVGPVGVVKELDSVLSRVGGHVRAVRVLGYEHETSDQTDGVAQRLLIGCVVDVCCQDRRVRVPGHIGGELDGAVEADGSVQGEHRQVEDLGGAATSSAYRAASYGRVDTRAHGRARAKSSRCSRQKRVIRTRQAGTRLVGKLVVVLPGGRLRLR